MKRKRIIKNGRTLADIRRIPKWARKVSFTCEVVEFDYELLKYFFADSKDVDSMSVRNTSCMPEINRDALTKWQD